MPNQSKILILPAIMDHIGVVLLAKEKGFEVITCDNVPDNPAHRFADKSYNINILDYEQLIDMAKKEQIDCVWGYSTDIGALAAAKVSAALGLGGNPFFAVDTMSDKAKFRLFLKTNGFNCPAFINGKKLEDFSFGKLAFPLVIKPVDRASSRGVTVIAEESEFQDAFNAAIEMSLSGEVIVEEFIDMEGCQLHGDAIVKDGEVVAFAVGDQYFSKHLHQAPIGTVLPSAHKSEVLEELRNEVCRFVNLIGYKNGGINVEARLNTKGELFIIELGPRSGGNYVPELLSAYLQIDIKEYLVSIMTGEKSVLPPNKIIDNVFQYIWRSSQSGKILGKQISDELEIVDSFDLKLIGDSVCHTPGADNIVAIYIIEGKTRAQVEDVYHNPENYFKLELSNN